MSMISPPKCSGVARINEGSYSFTCDTHVYPRIEWASLPLLPVHSASRHFGRYLFLVPLRVRCWVGWLHTEVVCPLPTAGGFQWIAESARTAHTHQTGWQKLLSRRSPPVERPSTKTTTAGTVIWHFQTSYEKLLVWRPKRIVTLSKLDGLD